MRKFLSSLLLGLLLSTSAIAAVDLNTATQSELESIKGIGPAKAKSIIDYRLKNGTFKTVDALASVKGFGKSSVAKFKGLLVVGGESKTPEVKTPAANAVEKK